MHDNMLLAVKIAKLPQILYGGVTGYFFTWWSLVPFSAIFLVLHLFTKADLEKQGLRQFIKLYVFVVFCAIQIFFILCYIFENFWVMLAVNFF